MDNIFFSVVITLYNKERAIKETIQSVLDQTYNNFELIIIDDGSTDCSSSVAKSFVDSRIKYVYKENGGVSSARNLGAKVASSNYLIYLDGDDLLYSDTLSNFAAVIDKYPEVNLIAAKLVRKTEKGLVNPSSTNYEGLVNQNKKMRWYYSRMIDGGIGRTLYDRRLVLKYPFDERCSRWEDVVAITKWINESKVYILNKNALLERQEFNNASKVLYDYSKDSVFHLDFAGLPFWGKMKYGYILSMGKRDYPQLWPILKKQYKDYLIYSCLSVIYRDLLYMLYIIKNGSKVIKWKFFHLFNRSIK